MQEIYLADIRRLVPFFDSCAVLLRAERREKMMTYSFFDDRLRCLAGGLLLEQAAGEQEICYTENGKPFLPEGPYVSLSHSGDFACMAVCDSAPVGIDIEQQRDEDFAGLGKTAFHPLEYDFFLREPGAVRFFNLWTLKESYVKMIGAGFSIEPSCFCVLPEQRLLPMEEKIYMQNFDCISGYSIAVCSLDPIEVQFIDMPIPPMLR